MKITKSQLKQIIKEELKNVLEETGDPALTRKKTPEEIAREDREAKAWAKSSKGRAYKALIDKLVPIANQAYPNRNNEQFISYLLFRAYVGNSKDGRWDPESGVDGLPENIKKRILRRLKAR
jgi:hypothetical protein